MGNVLLLVSVPMVATFVIWLLGQYKKRQENTWKQTAEGVFDHTESRTSTMRFRHPFWMTLVTITTIFFQDGNTWPILGVLHNPPAPGTMIHVYKNGVGQSRIEIDQAA